MAKAKRKSNGSSKHRAKRSTQDAISLLKADHREVEGWFEQFEKARSQERKVELADKICTALKVHTRIEEEIFYPAFPRSHGRDQCASRGGSRSIEGAKKLIATIEEAGPDDYYDARIHVLSEMIKHHVKEEEKRDGMFAKARASDMDLKAVGEQLQDRKKQLMGERSSGTSFLESLSTAATR